MGRFQLHPQGGPEVPHLVVGPDPEPGQPEERGPHGHQPGQPLGATQADPPPHELDRHHQGEQHPDGPREGGGEPEEGGQGEVRPAGRSGPQGQEAPEGEAEQGGLGVAHDEHERRRAEAEEPDGPAGQRGIAGLPAGQCEEQDGGHERGHVGDHQQGRAVVHPGQPGQGVGEKGEGGEEAEPLLAERVVAHPGDRLVVAGVPTEQALVHPRPHPGRRRMRAVDDEVGQAERPQHHGPGGQEREHGLADRLAQPPDHVDHDRGAYSVRFIGS